MLLQNVCFHALVPDGRPDFMLTDVSNLDTINICGNAMVISAITETGIAHSFNIYPNPVTNQLNINVDASLLGSEMKLCDINGRLLKLNIICNLQNTLSLNTFPSGYYLLQIKKDSAVFSKKIVKITGY